MQIEKLIRTQVRVWDSKVMAIPYASMQYKEHLKQFIDGLVEIEEKTLYQDKPKHGSWQEGWNDAKKDAILHLKEIRKQLE